MANSNTFSNVINSDSAIISKGGFSTLSLFPGMTAEDGLPLLGLSWRLLKLGSSSSCLILDTHFFTIFRKFVLVAPLPKQEIQSQLSASDGHPVMTSFPKHNTKSGHVETIFFYNLSLKQ